jgi:hypothetical protein
MRVVRLQHNLSTEMSVYVIAMESYSQVVTICQGNSAVSWQDYSVDVSKSEPKEELRICGNRSWRSKLFNFPVDFSMAT